MHLNDKDPSFIDKLDILWGIDIAPSRVKAESIGHAIKQLNLHPEDVIYVGDTVKDYRSATSNGVRFIGINYGFDDLKKAQMNDQLSNSKLLHSIVDSPEELKDVLESVI